MAKQSDGRKFLSSGHPSDRVWMGLESNTTCLGGKGATEYEGFWNGIHGK